MGADSFMSRVIPWGRPSMMSIRTTSARPFWTTRMAVVAPTKPLPTTVARTAGSASAVAGAGSDRAHDPVAALDHDPAHRSCWWLLLEMAIRLFRDLLVDHEARVHPAGERQRELERPVLPDPPDGVEVAPDERTEQLLLVRLLEPLH